MGRYFAKGKGHGLGAYASSLCALAETVNADVPAFPIMLTALREARNDAVHLGAAARRITHQATDVALVLEDALQKHANLGLVDHYMVEHPTCAEKWQTVGMVRQAILRMQFSALPYRLSEKDDWKLLTDESVVCYLANGGDAELTVEEASSQGLRLNPAKQVQLQAPVGPLRSEGCLPVIVVDRNNNIRGVITAFDLL